MADDDGRAPRPVRVALLSPGLECGREASVTIAADTPLLEVKRQLALATGVPVAHQKLLLSGINQLVMLDRRTQRYAHCGTASSIYYAVTAPPAEKASAPGGK